MELHIRFPSYVFIVLASLLTLYVALDTFANSLVPDTYQGYFHAKSHSTIARDLKTKNAMPEVAFEPKGMLVRCVPSCSLFFRAPSRDFRTAPTQRARSRRGWRWAMGQS